MKICICTVIKDEQEYLEDWIKYNIYLGIDKIYIVEDINSSSHKSITEKYKEVELIHFDIDEELESGRARQSYLQTKIFEKIIGLNLYDWCFIMDIDEYITIEDNIILKNLLSQFTDYSEVLLYWKNYGASGHIEKPDYSKVSSYREYYTETCWFTDQDIKFTHIIKKAINLNNLPQNYTVNQHLPSVSNYIKTNMQKGTHNPCYDKMYINHYITKSWEEYIWKLLVRGMCCEVHRKIDDFFEMNEDLLPRKEELISQIEDIIKKYKD